MKRIFLIFSLITLLGIAPAALGQSNAITVENAAEVVSLGRLGRGTPLALAWSPDGGTLAVGTTIGIWFYDGADLTAEPRLLESTAFVNAIAYSADGTHIAAGMGRFITVWEIESGEQVLSVESTDRNPVVSVTFNVDGSQVFGGSEGGLITAIDTATGETLALLEGHTNDVEALVFSPDGSALVSGSTDSTIRVWSDLAEKTVLEGHTSSVMGLAFSSDGSTLYSAGDDQTVRLWNTATWAESAQWQPENGSYVVNAALSPDGSTLMVGETNNSSIRFWDTASGTEKMVIEAHKWRVVDIALSPDGSTLASVGQDAWLNLIDAATGEISTTSYDHTDEAWSVAFNPDSSLLSVSYDMQNLRVWDVAAQTVVHREDVAFRIGFSENVAFNLFSPDGSKLATVDSFNVQVFDTATWTHLYTTVEGANTMLFSPDGSLLIAADWAVIYIYNAADGTLLAEITGHTGIIRGLAMNADGTLLASASEDGTARLWGIQ